MDAPAHCIAGAMGISDIPIQSLISPYRIIDVSDRAHECYQVSTLDIEEYENEYGLIPKGAFVIFYTGWDKFWDYPEKYRNNLIFPSLSKEAANKILTRNIVGIGIDTLSPDTADTDFPVHQIILNANKYIIENISNVKKIRGKSGYIIALPLKIEGGTESPIRLVGMIKNIP
jgi:kynurenine formamidase